MEVLRNHLLILICNSLISGLCGPSDQSEQMLRIRQLRQPAVGSGGYSSHEWFSDRHEAFEGPAQET